MFGQKCKRQQCKPSVWSHVRNIDVLSLYSSSFEIEWRVLARHTGLPKNGTVFLFCFCLLTDFQNYFTVRIRRKFVIIISLKIPPRLRCVATLPCEMSSVLKATIENEDDFCNNTLHIFCPQTARTWIQSIALLGVLFNRWFINVDNLRQSTSWSRQSSLSGTNCWSVSSIAPLVSGVVGFSRSSRSKANKLNIWCKNCSIWVTLNNNWDNKHVVPCC